MLRCHVAQIVYCIVWLFIVFRCVLDMGDEKGLNLSYHIREYVILTRQIIYVSVRPLRDSLDKIRKWSINWRKTTRIY